MAKQVIPGKPVVLDAYYRNNAGVSAEPENPFVSIVYPDGSEAVHLAVPTQVLDGHYQYVYNVPEEGPLGAWGALWYGKVEGFDLDDDDGFTVVAPGSITASSGLCSVEDLEVYMQRHFTDFQAANASVTLGAVQAEAEEFMNRGVVATSRTETHQQRPGQTFIPLRYGPVHSIISVTVGGTELDSGQYQRRTTGIMVSQGYPSVPSAPGISFVPFDEVEVVFVGGVDDPRKLKTIREVILGRSARKVQRAIDHAHGASSLSVEGYSAGLMDDNWTEDELKVLMLNRPKARGSTGGGSQQSAPLAFNNVYRPGVG